MKYKPYPEDRYSGVEWLGQIPVHWGGGKRLVRIEGGETPSKDHGSFWSVDSAQRSANGETPPTLQRVHLHAVSARSETDRGLK